MRHQCLLLKEKKNTKENTVTLKNIKTKSWKTIKVIPCFGNSKISLWTLETYQNSQSGHLVVISSKKNMLPTTVKHILRVVSNYVNPVVLFISIWSEYHFPSSKIDKNVFWKDILLNSRFWEVWCLIFPIWYFRISLHFYIFHRSLSGNLYFIMN